MDLDRRQLILFGVSMMAFMTFLEVIGTLAVKYSSEGAVIIYYVVVSTFLAGSIVFTIFQLVMNRRESIIV